MKKSAIIRIIVFSLTIVILSAILLAGVAQRPFFGSSVRNRYRTSGTLAQDPTQEAAGSSQPSSSPTQGYESASSEGDAVYQASANISEIEIEWVSGNIVIVPGDVDRIQVRDSGSTANYRTVFEEEDGCLSIEFSDESVHFHGFGFGISISKDLYITVPRNWECRELNLDVASARVEVSDLTITEVDFDGASGDCIFTNCTVSSLDMDTASGDIQFSGTLNVLDCDAASASLTCDLLNVPSRMDIDSASGDMNITLPSNAGFILTMDALSGNFSTDFATTSRDGSHICGDGYCRIDVSCLSGDVNIRQCHNEDHTQCHSQGHH